MSSLKSQNSLQPLRRGGKEAGSHISFLFKQTVSPLPRAGVGVVGSHDWPRERAPLAHISQTPRRGLLSGALSNFLP